MTKTDRRVQRTRELLQKTLIELITERGYDAITIQDIVDRANIGRTTFYLHYNSKEELFMSCHEATVAEFHSLHPRSREELLSPEAPPGMVSVYRHLLNARALLHPIFQGKDSLPILRRIRDRSAQEIEASLRAAFAEADGTIPLDVLANYLAGAQIALVQWWLEKRQPHSPENLAQTFHRLQRAAIRDAFGLRDGE
ncbi:MAG TPA: TetR/AcrR family transcriptional regulator [Candidatus Udaeobacter sp.]|jgi:AcrR family transcriptional regulator|nr:TetR/AcrR family transcriptional regulator [Candidatus Udaeobacter sp.]